MQLCANYSPALVELLPAGEADVDRIKITVNPDAFEQTATARPLRPLLLHGLAEGAPLGQSDFFDALARERFDELVALTGTPHLSGHIAGLGEDVGEAETLSRLAADARSVADRFGLPLHLESLPYYSWGRRPRFLAEPAFLGRLIEGSGCYLLLDLAHHRCSAYQLGLSDAAYLGRLPLERVREIHVNSPIFVPGEGWRDRHLDLSEKDYRLIAWLFDRAPIEIVTLEYGLDARPDRPDLARVPNDPERLKEQIARLRALIGS